MSWPCGSGHRDRNDGMRPEDWLKSTEECGIDPEKVDATKQVNRPAMDIIDALIWALYRLPENITHIVQKWFE